MTEPTRSEAEVQEWLAAVVTARAAPVGDVSGMVESAIRRGRRRTTISVAGTAASLAVVIVVAVWLLPSLGSGHDREPSSQQAAYGTVRGHLRGVGGMPPGINRPFPGSIHVIGNGVDVQIPVGADGNYSLSVPPGEYTVAGHSPNLTDNGVQEPCGPAPDGKPVTVVADQVTIVDVFCSLK